jgi:hypothetical protein
MDDAVDRVMASYENLPALERLGREEIRMKVSQYLEKLSSAGHSDAEELTFYGLAYLRILHEGPDPRYTGCWQPFMLNDREKILSALREKPLKVYAIMKRANIPNEEACQSLLLKMRGEGLVKFDIHKGQWLIGWSVARLRPAKIIGRGRNPSAALPGAIKPWPLTFWSRSKRISSYQTRLWQFQKDSPLSKWKIGTNKGGRHGKSGIHE